MQIFSLVGRSPCLNNVIVNNKRITLIVLSACVHTRGYRAGLEEQATKIWKIKKIKYKLRLRVSHDSRQWTNKRRENEDNREIIF